MKRFLSSVPLFSSKASESWAVMVIPIAQSAQSGGPMSRELSFDKKGQISGAS